MDLGKIANGVLGALAPTIRLALPGPFGALAASALTSVLGLPAEAKADEISAALANATPEQLVAIKKVDADFQIKMKELGISEAQMGFADIASARQMQIATKDFTPRVMAGVITGGLFGLLAVLAFVNIPTTNHDALMLLLGSLNTAFGSVVGFYFGSSSSSQRKDETIKAAVSGTGDGAIIPFPKAA